MGDDGDKAGSPRPDGVRDRIVAAATTEFAEYGIAGARVDRIAKKAKTSKERVYAYFDSKEALYTQTAAMQLDVILETTALEGNDLPGYAGRLYDYYETHSDHYRLVSWGRLELLSSTRSDSANRSAAIRTKVEAIKRAQDEGTLDPALDALDVLALVGQIATTWIGQPELRDAAAEYATDPKPAARRAAVVARARTPTRQDLATTQINAPVEGCQPLGWQGCGCRFAPADRQRDRLLRTRADSSRKGLPGETRADHAGGRARERPRRDAWRLSSGRRPSRAVRSRCSCLMSDLCCHVATRPARAGAEWR